jgi:hypothetical protein
VVLARLDGEGERIFCGENGSDLGGSGLGSDLEQGGGGVGRGRRREECGDAEEMETGGS